MGSSSRRVGSIRSSVFLTLALVMGSAASALDIPTSHGNGADTFLTNDSNRPPDSVLGSRTSMEIRQDAANARARILYLRFDLSGFGGVIDGATITLNGITINADRPLVFHGLKESPAAGAGEGWSESGTSYSNASGVDPTAPPGSFALSADATAAPLARTAGSAAGSNTTVPNPALDAFLAADTDGLVTFIAFIDPSAVTGSEYFFFSTKEGGVAPVLNLPEDVDNDGLSDDWEDFHFGNGDGSPSAAELALQDGTDDPDGDGFDNEEEESAATDPNDPAAFPGGPHFIYVDPGGSDTNAGTIDAPFATVARAQQAASPGSTVYFRGGTYAIGVGQVAEYSGIFARVFLLDKSGTEQNPIRYWEYPGEEPVFDLMAVTPPDYRIYTFYVTGNWLHFRGLTVTGVQVTITDHTQSICFDNEGSHNIYERLVMRDSQAIGMWIGKGSDNLVLNCDAYRNWDYTSEDGKGGNVDGFGCHANAGTGNVFRGCRAWFNSDDGFDCINLNQPVIFENCWAFYNGYNPSFQSLGNGIGFKAGGYGSKTAEQLPNPIPRHVVRNCLAVRNRVSGFYANHHPSGVTFIGNTALRNRPNYNMLSRTPDNSTDVDGYDHLLRNNLGYDALTSELTNVDLSACDASHNYFDLPVTVSAADFQSLDEALLAAPRQPDGKLPVVPFMRLNPGSDLIDRGKPEGKPFAGEAPDLGCFERDAIGIGNHDFSLPGFSAQKPRPAGMIWVFEPDAGVRPAGGSQVAYLGGSGEIRQTCDGFEIGKTYHIHLEAAAPSGSADLTVLIDDATLGTLTAGGPGYGPLDVIFTASASAHTLRLAGAGSPGEVRIASVRITRLTAVSDSDTDDLRDAWEFQWFDHLGETAWGDFDGDGTSNNAEEALALDPTSGASAFRALLHNGELTWPGVAGIDFSVTRSTDFDDWEEIAVVPGTAPFTVYTDPNPPPDRAFYRVLFTP